MKLFLDTADVKQIKTAVSWGVIDGVTTNPSLVKKSGKTFKAVVKDIAGMVEGPVSAEVVALSTSGMVKEAKVLAKIAPNIVVKIPMIPAGVAAAKKLSHMGIATNMTLVFNATQALLAAKVGAKFVSPFVGRLDDIGKDGMGLIEEIVQIYDNFHFKTEVLVASVRNTKHLTEAALIGADVATVPFSVMEKMFQDNLTDVGLERFMKDWNSIPASKRKIA